MSRHHDNEFPDEVGGTSPDPRNAGSPGQGPAGAGGGGIEGGIQGGVQGGIEGFEGDDATPEWTIPPRPLPPRPVPPPGRPPESFSGASEPGGPGRGPGGRPGTSFDAGSGGYAATGGGGGTGMSGRSGAAPLGAGGSGARQVAGGLEGRLGDGGLGGFYGGGPGGPPIFQERPRRRRRTRELIVPLAGAVMLAVLAGVGVYAFAARSGCSSDGEVKLVVAAAPDIAPAVAKAAGRFNDADHKAGDKCLKATVQPTEPAAMTLQLTGQSAAPTAQKPDLWIPDSAQWTALVRNSAKGKQAVQMTKTSVAQSPVVVAIPQTLAARLQRQGGAAKPSWSSLLQAAGGRAGDKAAKDQVVPPGSVRLYAPDPTRVGTGMVSLMIPSTLLAKDPNRDATFTGVVRTVRDNIRPTVDAGFGLFSKKITDRYPIVLAPEQAVWKHNRRGPAERAVAVYPVEGTMSLDYPVTLTAGAQGDRAAAARELVTALGAREVQEDVRALGFRSADGRAPGGFGVATGVNPQRPRPLPAPSDAQVGRVMQSWSRLALSIRMLALFDVSGSMNEKVAPGTTRLQATIRVAQGGVSLFPDDTELGTWVFSTKLKGDQDWLETVPIGPLGQRIGSATRRQLVLSGLAATRVKRRGDTGLYESIMASYRMMTKTHKAEFVNSIMLLTDGKNDDPGGPSLGKTLDELRKIRDDNRPVRVIMIGFGKGVDTGELKQIAEATGGSVHVAQRAEDVQKIFLQAVSRRTQN